MGASAAKRIAPGFHSEAIEKMPREELEALQLRRLAATVDVVKQNVPAFTDRLAKVNTPASLHGIRDIPFTKKTDLRDNYPFGLFAVPRHEVKRVHASSGTTGKPTVVGYTAEDLTMWAQCVARCLRGAGIEPGWMLHNAYGYGLFTGGLGLHAGAEEAGISVVPVSGGNTERQLILIEDFAPESICCTPSYALTLAEHLSGENSLQVGVLGAEPWSELMREQIEEKLSMIAVNIYGLSEVIGPGVACETADRQGLVVMEDHFYPEVVHPETGEVLDDGEVGVLVLTSLTKQAFPILRYWTGDLCSLTREPSPCGRTHARISSIVGRSDDMIVIRGVNVYPSQVEHALLGVDLAAPHFRLVVTREGTLDNLTVEVEPVEGAGKIDDIGERLSGRVSDALRSSLGIGVAVTVAEPGSLPRSEGGKLSRVDDRRTL
ncbi:MAG: phenylacetate--CoA ligase [Actinobacteria bacterium]|nr:phenylacetate--CoA ligase [Ilumatobacteraceae bacterium]MDA0299339.1 phenylacetate--CoA ligase [Actinomycetota bacterium]MDA2962057.1 phenylacetate--CoA ligase [Actinomycetota bacterium]MDA2995113.1 phenylacetate--CoA ligase [Actinomycetota bacterium]